MKIVNTFWSDTGCCTLGNSPTQTNDSYRRGALKRKYLPATEFCNLSFSKRLENWLWAPSDLLLIK